MKLRRTLAKLVILLTPVAFLSILLSLQRDLDARETLRTINDDNTFKQLPLSPESTHSSTILLNPDMRFNALAIAVKTGPEVAFDRIPIQVVSFLHRVSHVLLIGSNGNFRLGPVTAGEGLMVHDVVTGSYDRVQNTRNISTVDAASLARAIQPPIRDSRDVIVPDTDSLGWRNDANKNLPGFKKLYEAYPDANWYMMIDDDTYLFLDNLMEYLEGLDPETPIYAGRANAFIGCDNVAKHGDGPAFAHGGSGIVLSKAAMKLFQDGYDSCMDRYSTCWAGDIRVGLCFRDLKTRVKSHIGFNGAPPNAELYWPKDPCARPFSFHHLPPRKMQDMRNLETRAASHDGEAGTRSGRVEYGFVYQSERAWGNATGWDVGVVWTGREVGQKDGQEVGGDAEGCRRGCLSNDVCLAFSWTPREDGAPGGVGKCFLYDWVQLSEGKEGAISGIFPERYSC